MIEAGEVGAVFTVVDEASAILLRLSRLFKELDGLVLKTQKSLNGFGRVGMGGLDAKIGALSKSLLGVSENAEVAALATGGAFAKIDTSLAATAAGVKALRTEMKELSLDARAIHMLNGPSFRNGGSGGGHGGGVSFGGIPVDLPGGQRAHISSGPGLAAGAAVAYGTFEEAKVQDFINRIFISGGHKTDILTSDPAYLKLREAILKSYTMTGLPLEQIEEGILTGVRGLAGIDFDKRLNLMPQLLTASSVEAYLKDGTSVPEAMQAFVGLAHMQGKYEPAEIGKLADHFAYLSTTTPLSVKQIEMAASYAIPMLRTADFNPEQLLLMITSMERAGIANSKAGTWIAQLGSQSFPGTSLMSKMLFAKHEDALKSLGLIDDKNLPTWFTDGKPDLVKMTGIAGGHIEAMDPAHRLAVEKALWGQQGGRAAGFFADPINREIMAKVADDEKNFTSGEKMWKQSLNDSPMVLFRTTLAGLNVELMNLGSNVLPYVTGALKAANQTLGGKGELAVGAGVLGGLMFRKSIAELAGKALPAAAAALSLPEVAGGAVLVSGAAGLLGLTHEIGQLVQPQKSAAQIAYENANGHGDGPLSVMSPRANYDASAAKALAAALPPPVVNNAFKVENIITLDGKAIAASTVTRIMKDGRAVNGAGSFDSGAHWAPPDMGR